MKNNIFLNPFTDFGFKKLFGEEGSKDLLINFLNQLLPAHRQVSTLAFVNPEVYPDSKEERKAIFDIHCKSISGERFIVEMQKARMEYFKDRALYYTTFPIRDQAQKGEWDYNLQPVYLIAILDFRFSESSSKHQAIKTDVMLKDQEGNVFYDKLHFCFVQMPFFDKNESQLETQFDKWLFFLKNLENFDHIPAVLNEPVFKRGFKIARLANLKPKELLEYNESIKKYLDMMNIIETAKKEGIKEGIKEGMVKVALNALKRGMPVKEIAALTGLSVAEIENLRDKLQDIKK